MALWIPEYGRSECYFRVADFLDLALFRSLSVPSATSFSAAAIRFSFLAQRASDALRAASLRCSGVRFLAVVFPPSFPNLAK